MGSYHARQGRVCSPLQLRSLLLRSSVAEKLTAPDVALLCCRGNGGRDRHACGPAAAVQGAGRAAAGPVCDYVHGLRLWRLPPQPHGEPGCGWALPGILPGVGKMCDCALLSVESTGGLKKGSCLWLAPNARGKANPVWPTLACLPGQWGPSLLPPRLNPAGLVGRRPKVQCPLSHTGCLYSAPHPHLALPNPAPLHPPPTPPHPPQTAVLLTLELSQAHTRLGVSYMHVITLLSLGCSAAFAVYYAIAGGRGLTTNSVAGRARAAYKERQWLRADAMQWHYYAGPGGSWVERGLKTSLLSPFPFIFHGK